MLQARIGYVNRMDMIRKNVKEFLQSLEMPENENTENPIINVVRFGTISEITTSGINTKAELEYYLSNQFDGLIRENISKFSAYENYDRGLNDGLKCVQMNKTINNNSNIVIVITDGNKYYNSSYCIQHDGDMSEFAKKFIDENGAIVYAVGIQTSTRVLDSMVRDKTKYVIKIYNNKGLKEQLTNIKNEITIEEEVEVVSEKGKILLKNVTEISPSKKINITVSGPVNTNITVSSPSDALIETIDGQYWLVLETLATRVGGRKNLDESKVEIHY